MGLPAPDLLSLMVQRSQAQEGPTEAGISPQLSLAPGRNKPFSCGALKALIPIHSQCLPVQPSSQVCGTELTPWVPVPNPQTSP